MPFVEQKFGCGGTGKRGVFGKSSGGYGAIVHAMLYPDFWAASACHSGDVGFELLELNDMPRVLRALAKEGGSIQRWLEAFFAKRKVKDDDVHVLMWLAMCATYDPDLTQFMGIRLPVDPETCEVIPERWANWMRWDPLTLAETARGGIEDAQAAVHRLRRRRPVQSGLWRAAPPSRARAPRCAAYLRGIPRRPLVHRLPHGREPAAARGSPLPLKKPANCPRRAQFPRAVQIFLNLFKIVR